MGIEPGPDGVPIDMRSLRRRIRPPKSKPLEKRIEEAVQAGISQEAKRKEYKKALERIGRATEEVTVKKKYL